MANANSGRSVMQGIAGVNGTKIGKKLKTPMGLPRVTPLFADMARHFGGTWFNDVDSQVDYHAKATVWEKRLSRFTPSVVTDAIAEVIGRGDYKAPSLETINYLCQRLSDEAASRSGPRSGSAKAARDKAMAKIRSGGLIHG